MADTPRPARARTSCRVASGCRARSTWAAPTHTWTRRSWRTCGTITGIAIISRHRHDRLNSAGPPEKQTRIARWLVLFSHRSWCKKWRCQGLWTRELAIRHAQAMFSGCNDCMSNHTSPASAGTSGPVAVMKASGPYVQICLSSERY